MLSRDITLNNIYIYIYGIDLLKVKAAHRGQPAEGEGHLQGHWLLYNPMLLKSSQLCYSMLRDH